MVLSEQKEKEAYAYGQRIYQTGTYFKKIQR